MNMKELLQKAVKQQDGFTEIGPDGKETNLRLHMEMVDEEPAGFVEAWVTARLKQLGIEVV